MAKDEKGRKKGAKVAKGEAGAVAEMAPIDPLAVLELQLSANAVQAEVLMRYVANPRNLGAIRKALGEVFEKLGALAWQGGCPPDWDHINCKCVPPNYFKMQ